MANSIPTNFGCLRRLGVMRRVMVPGAIAGLLLTGCGPAATTAGSGDALTRAWSLVYNCEAGQRFSTRASGERLFLVLRGRSHELVPDPDEPRRYAGDGLLFSGGTEDATLIGPSFRYSDCDALPASSPWEDAALRDVVYRAVGQEPGWFTEVVPDGTLLFVGDYGELIMVGEAPVEHVDSVRHRTDFTATTPDGPLRLVVQTARCIDVMSGEGYPTRAIVTAGERTFQGCGRWIGGSR